MKTSQTISTQDLLGKPLRLTQKGLFKREYQLFDGEREIGSMRFPGFFGHNAELVTAAGEEWEVVVPSIWKHQVEIRQKGYSLPIATYKGSYFKGTGELQLPMGERIQVGVNIWRSQYTLESPAGNTLVSAQVKFSLKANIELSIEKRSEILEKHKWLLLVLCYIIIGQREKQSAVS